MQSIFQKTLGGLAPQYYFRQLFFGLLIGAFIFYVSTNGGKPMPVSLIFFVAINTLLYPYSRFVYESIVGFIMGDNVFFVNAIAMLLVKAFTMSLCWAAAVFIAPFGLAYLYFHHSKAAR